MLRSVRLAIGFLTVLPVAPRDVTHMGPARAYFPLVGLALGTILAALDFAARQALPSPAVGAILVVALLVLTRAIHTEGFMDACDGLFGGYSRSERLEILRDSHVGAFAVAGGISLLLLKWTLLTGASGEARAGLLIMFPCLSRLGMLFTMNAFTYVRKYGIGTLLPGGNQPLADRVRPRYCSGSGRTAPWSRWVGAYECGYWRILGLGQVDFRAAGRHDRRYLRRRQ